MKATDFDLAENLEYDLETGITRFGDNRMVIYSADAIGLLRHLIIEEFGFEKAREMLLRFGFRNGYSDGMQLDIGYDWESEMELLEVAPRLHTYEGIVRAEVTEVEIGDDGALEYLEGEWHNSYEAQQHLSFYEEADEPVCWSLMGHATGLGAYVGEVPHIQIETECVGMGHDHCKTVSKPIDEWGSEADVYREAYGDLLEV